MIRMHALNLICIAVIKSNSMAEHAAVMCACQLTHTRRIANLFARAPHANEPPTGEFSLGIHARNEAEQVIATLTSTCAQRAPRSCV